MVEPTNHERNAHRSGRTDHLHSPFCLLVTRHSPAISVCNNPSRFCYNRRLPLIFLSQRRQVSVSVGFGLKFQHWSLWSRSLPSCLDGLALSTGRIHKETLVFLGLGSPSCLMGCVLRSQVALSLPFQPMLWQRTSILKSFSTSAFPLERHSFRRSCALLCVFKNIFIAAWCIRMTTSCCEDRRRRIWVGLLLHGKARQDFKHKQLSHYCSYSNYPYPFCLQDWSCYLQQPDVFMMYGKSMTALIP
jgi:hypothetical protein